MKYILLTLFALLFMQYIIAQNYEGRSIVLFVNEHQNKAYLAGNLPKSNDGVYQKLKISVFGGNWHNSNIAENDYFISTRDGIAINQEVHGGSYSKYELKIYDAGNSYDFVIVPNDHFSSFCIKSWLHNKDGMKGLPITDYSSEGKTEITNSVKINKLLVTTHGGAIGIGKSPDASAKLDVAGTIRATEIKVEAQTADFVFDDNYTLRDLKEVESFITQHKHLPDIPSAAQMEADGVNLAEMNKLLLQKIEELTLYVIEKEKQVASLENETGLHKKQVQSMEKRLTLLESLILKE